MRDTKLSNGDLLPDEMDVKLNVLGSPVMHWVLGHIDRRDVVAECYGRRRYLAEQLAKEMTKPRALGDGVGDGAVLGLGTRPRHSGLSLGGPRDEGVVEEHAEA